MVNQMIRKVKTVIISFALIAALGLAFTGGCTFNSGTSQGVNTALIKEASTVIHQYYVEPAKLDDKKMTEGAIRGMMDALNDPHSAYLTKEEVDMEAAFFKGQPEGIGILTKINTLKQFAVVEVYTDSPAEKAGIKVGDVILAINGTDITGMQDEDVLALISGPKGTAVTLSILHANSLEPVTIDVVRALLDFNSVDFEMRSGIAYLIIYQFTERTDEEITPYLQTITENGAKGIILDLRGNPGGLQDVVVDVASHFLSSGVVLTEVDRDGKKTPYDVTDVTPKILDLPMVVLVDQDSASASEVCAGVLQDYGRALIAGTTTYGKGSVNILARLSDGSGIYITIARWLTPNGHLIEGKGIHPDRELDFTQTDGIQWAVYYLLQGY
jgi:carboxyl-terminal processing protease